MTLREFLSALATDADQLAAFQANPDKAMQDAGLSSEEQELVKSGNQERVYRYFQELEPDKPLPSYKVVEANKPPEQE